MGNGRRRVINLLLGGGFLGWLGTVFYPVIRYLKPPELNEPVVRSVNVGKAAEIAVNSGQIVKFGRQPLILIRTERGEFRVFTAICTHLDCIVQYRPDFKHIWCACHNGHYDQHGKNISGPPPRPLDEYVVNIIDDEVIVTMQPLT